MDIEPEWGPGAPYYPHMEWVDGYRFGFACACIKGVDHEGPF